MSAVLDDMDSRPGSTTSLLRTVIGLYLRDAGGWMPTKHLVVLMEALGVAPAITRTALSRLKKKGVVVPQVRQGTAGFVLTDGAAAMLARGDRRIFNPRLMSAGDRWCLVSFSIPEKEREKRHQLRRRLHWVGCGMVAAGLWISPDFLRDEVEEILEDLGLRGMATMFTADTPQVGGSLREAAAAWWDLDAVAELHRDFIRQYGGFASNQDASVEVSAETFATFVRCIDHWRTIPYLDPGLPPEFLPTDWPGAEGTSVFRRIVSSSSQPSKEFVRSVAGN
ncbi:MULTISPECIES: PaaX family transcriptional regulator C-terminal domain-containing protein [Arthrobacter]|uniref:Regulator n=1 Tax=Arthrobacter terricola TaxID=2547396 RepID=A0A4V2ZU72_9MICC|nr:MULTISPECIES: PaaX family transcriptional regulator C-terminal domain-containing protein [Arthrobacter]MBT8160387.1 regulator [Arthrobacter sp. GN70]TDF99924.1 regulator [Arthrobacter terricola]